MLWLMYLSKSKYTAALTQRSLTEYVHCWQNLIAAVEKGEIWRSQQANTQHSHTQISRPAVVIAVC